MYSKLGYSLNNNILEGSDSVSKKIMVAGHICLDITPVFPEKKVEAIEHFLTPGKLLHTKEAVVHTGGAVANTGLALKVLGADVSLVGKIGNDDFGKIVLEKMKEHNAEKNMLVCEGETTSYTVVLAIPGIDRIFLHNPGANDTFKLEDILDDTLEDTALFHFGYPPLMKKMYENEGEELVKLMKYMKSREIATSLDMAMSEQKEENRVNWHQILKEALPYVDFFVPSIEELCCMLDQERYFEWQKRAAGKDITSVLDIATDVVPIANQCMELGAKVLIIKCGSLGIYYQVADSPELQKIGAKIQLDVDKWANKTGFEKSYIPDQILSGTGAGDTSIAAFLKAVLDGYSVEKCLQYATATGANCVAAYDALSGLKSFEEIDRKIENGWKKNN